jgi:hypothetical protein
MPGGVLRLAPEGEDLKPPAIHPDALPSNTLDLLLLAYVLKGFADI